MKSLAPIINPATIKEVEEALSLKKIVIYTSETGTKFVLNPFGGGQTATAEKELLDTWKVTEDKLNRITIVNLY